jgi:hypothetical protein
VTEDERDKRITALLAELVGRGVDISRSPEDVMRDVHRQTVLRELVAERDLAKERALRTKIEALMAARGVAPHRFAEGGL